MFPRITALVPEGEHFDSTALNEGIWMTVAHFNAIELGLEGHYANAVQITGERDAAQQDLSALQLQLTQVQSDANAAATQAHNDLQQRDQQIKSLQSEIATLKKGPAGDFSATTTDEDQSGKINVASHESDSNPLNQVADKFFGKPRK